MNYTMGLIKINIIFIKYCGIIIACGGPKFVVFMGHPLLPTNSDAHEHVFISCTYKSLNIILTASFELMTHKITSLQMSKIMVIHKD
jgi:hypothetical protein